MTGHGEQGASTRLRSTRPTLRRWALACAAGETAGMAAAASTAGVIAVTIGEPSSAGERAAVLAAMVGAGCVEGLAVGVFQWRALRRWLPRLRARSYIGVTVAVGALGWLLGMLPVTLSPPAEGAAGTEPPFAVMAAVVVLGGAGAGLVFGAAQAAVLRRHVAHPWRWVSANAAGWAVAMSVIFVGASTPPAGLPVVALLGWGAVTGVLAGGALGLVTGLFLPRLDRAGRPEPVGNRVVRTVLASSAHGLLSRGVLGIEYVGPRSGRPYALPVHYAADGDRLLVAVGRPEAKTWWRAFLKPHGATVVLRSAVVEAVLPGDPRYGELATRYLDATGHAADPAWPLVTVERQGDRPRGWLTATSSTGAVT